MRCYRNRRAREAGLLPTGRTVDPNDVRQLPLLRGPGRVPVCGLEGRAGESTAPEPADGDPTTHMGATTRGKMVPVHASGPRPTGLTDRLIPPRATLSSRRPIRCRP